MKIDKDIPKPKGINPGLTETMRKMDVGDSIVVMGSAPAHVVARNIGIKVATRKTDVAYQVRVWRIE